VRLLVFFSSSFAEVSQSGHRSPREPEQASVIANSWHGRARREIVTPHVLNLISQLRCVNRRSSPLGRVVSFVTTMDPLPVLEVQITRQHRHRGQSDNNFNN
jgi:hypothetical protein